MSTADRMAVLDKGVVQQVGTPAALYDDPANTFVANFVGTMNLLPAQVRESGGSGLLLDIDGVGPLRLASSVSAARPAPGARVVLSCRPQALQLHAAAGQAPAGLGVPGAADRAAAAAAGLAVLDGAVEASEFLGGFTRYHVRVGPHRLAVDQTHRAGAPRFSAGMAVTLGLAPDQLRLLAD